jgi:MoaA/NifB/PqqE/SkfB family radical SAM enzyme
MVMGNSILQKEIDHDHIPLTGDNTIYIREIGNQAIPGPPQEIISGRRSFLIRLRIRARIVRIIFRNYRSISLSVKILRSLLSFRQSALGENKVMKYVRVDGKYFLGLYIPSFYSKAFEAFILGEVNRIVPSGKQSNRFTSVLFAITKKCALKCEHCSEWETLNGNETLSLADLKRIVSRFQKLGTAQIHFSGGEPLQRIDDLLEVLKITDKKTECWVLTSGNNLTRENAKRLKSAGLTGVVISIDHFDPDAHNRFRGSQKAFVWAEQAVRNAKEANLVAAISICVTKSFISTRNLYAYAEMAKRMGVAYIQIFEPSAVGHYQDKDVELTAGQVKILEDFFFTLNHSEAFREYPVVLYHGYYQRRIGCFSSANRHVYVDSDGDIRDCPFCRTKAGNALNEDIGQIVDQLRITGCHKFKTISI